MIYGTDQKLKDYLSSNQAMQELLCAALLPLDRRFSAVIPQQPWGGPDKGKDITALYNKSQTAFCAIGFVNSANDSRPQRTQIIAKFKDDLRKCLLRHGKFDVFVFFTNVDLTITDRDKLQKHAQESGIQQCEIFNRDRMRLLLDSPDGFSIRFQYLDIPLSEAEQATFFAKWGNDIQSLVTEGFTNIEASLNRIQFFHEAEASLSVLAISLELDRTYTARELGHFRAFCSTIMLEPISGIQNLLFGEADNSSRIKISKKQGAEKLVQEYGSQCGMQWNTAIFERPSKRTPPKKKSNEQYCLTGSHSGYREEESKFIYLKYQHSGFLRTEPVPIKLKHLDDCMFIFMTNKSLAEKISCIRVYANCYKLVEIAKNTIRVDEPSPEGDIPMLFSTKELNDPWVRIRPTNASCFELRFSETTPRRTFQPKDIVVSKG